MVSVGTDTLAMCVLPSRTHSCYSQQQCYVPSRPGTRVALVEVPHSVPQTWDPSNRSSAGYWPGLRSCAQLDFLALYILQYQWRCMEMLLTNNY